MIPQDKIEEVRAINGASTVLGSQPTTETTTDEDGNEIEQEVPGEAPFGYTLVGSIDQLERIADNMDEYGLSFTDLSAEKQEEFELAHDALQWHVAKLGNSLADNFVGKDDSIELRNGNSIKLPKDAQKAGGSKDLPDTPTN